jgi:hypothetical protein
MKRIKEKVIYKHADDTYSKGFSQIRKKSVVVCINLRRLRAYCLNQNLSDLPDEKNIK